MIRFNAIFSENLANSNSCDCSIGLENLFNKACLKWPLKITPKLGFQNRLSLSAGRKYCRVLPLEHSAILLTCTKLPFSIKTLVMFIFKWPLKTGLTVLCVNKGLNKDHAILVLITLSIKCTDLLKYWL